MGIRVECPNGHVFKVKDKYAGKKGICPHCEGKVIVEVPSALSKLSESVSDESVVDDYEGRMPSDASGSLLGSGSIVQHTVECTNCKRKVPFWYATCPACGQHLDNR